MNDRQLDRLLRAAQPHLHGDPLPGGDPGLHAAGHELLEQIMTMDHLDATHHDPARHDPAEPGDVITLDPAPSPSRRPARRRATIALAAAAAVAVGIGVPVYVNGLSGHSTPPATVADAGSTRVLLDLPDWKLTYAFHEAGYWEVQYANGRQNLQISSYAAAEYAGREEKNRKTESVEVLGVAGTLHVDGGGRIEVQTEPRSGSFLEIYADGLDRAGFDSLLAGLRWTDERGFAASAGGDFVTPETELRNAQQMTKDISLPPGLEPKDLLQHTTNSYYNFAAAVTGAVTCRWIEVYVRATRTGDDEAVSRARKAMGQARDWQVLRTIESQGGWSSVLWEYADAVSKGTPVTGGSDKVDLANSYRNALGCR